MGEGEGGEKRKICSIEQHCSIELSVMVKRFYICAVQFGSQ